MLQRLVKTDSEKVLWGKYEKGSEKEGEKWMEIMKSSV